MLMTLISFNKLKIVMLLCGIIIKQTIKTCFLPNRSSTHCKWEAKRYSQILIPDGILMIKLGKNIYWSLLELRECPLMCFMLEKTHWNGQMKQLSPRYLNCVAEQAVQM